MGIIACFPDERDWSEDINALALNIMRGIITVPLETRSGVLITTRTGIEIDCKRKDGYNTLASKPAINGVELFGRQTAHDLKLASEEDFYSLSRRIAILEEAVSVLEKTPFLIANIPGSDEPEEDPEFI